MELAVGESCRIEQTVTPAVAPAVKDAQLYVQTRDTHVEETPWWEHAHRQWVWTVVTAQVRGFALATARGAAV